MRKIFFMIVTALCTLTLSSCLIGGGRMSEIGDKRAEAHLEQILEAISASDTDTIQAMFSEQAQSDALDLPGSIDALFSFIQGTIESWEHWTSRASESND